MIEENLVLFLSSGFWVRLETNRASPDPWGVLASLGNPLGQFGQVLGLQAPNAGPKGPRRGLFNLKQAFIFRQALRFFGNS